MVLVISIVLLSAATFVLASPAIMQLLSMADNGVSEGIGFYAPPVSSVSICEWLTLGKDEPGRDKRDPELFVNKFSWGSAPFRYERKNSFLVHNEAF